MQWEIDSRRVPLVWQREKELSGLSSQMQQMQSLVERIEHASSGDMNRITQLGYQLASTHNDLVTLENRGRCILTRPQQALEPHALAEIDDTRQRRKAFAARGAIARGAGGEAGRAR